MVGASPNLRDERSRIAVVAIVHLSPIPKSRANLGSDGATPGRGVLL